MKRTIQKTESKIVKNVIESFEIEIPEKQIYLFETGIRRSISVRPLWTTWEKDRCKDEWVHSLEITVVYNGDYRIAIEFYTIQTNRIEEIISQPHKSTEQGLIDYIILQPQHHDKRTEGQFLDDFNRVVNAIKDSIHAITYINDEKI